MTAGRNRRVANGRHVQVAPVPALGAAPFDELPSGQVQVRRRGRQGQAPQDGVAREKGMALLADSGPPEIVLVLDGFAPDGLRGRGDGRLGAGEADKKPFAIVAGGGDGQWGAGPGVHESDGLARRLLLHQGPLRRGERHHLQAHLQQQAQGAVSPRHEAGKVVARHVLHHLAAETQHLPAAGEDADPQHQVPRRPGVGAGRSREAAGNGAAEGGAQSQAGRLEGQHLPLFRQCGLDGLQGGPATGRDDQFLGLVVDDPGVAGHVQGFAGRGTAQKSLGPAAADLQWGAGFDGGEYARLQRFGRVIVHGSGSVCA